MVIGCFFSIFVFPPKLQPMAPLGEHTPRRWRGFPGSVTPNHSNFSTSSCLVDVHKLLKKNILMIVITLFIYLF